MAQKPTLASLQKHVDEQQAVIDVLMKRVIELEVKVHNLPGDQDFMAAVVGQVVQVFQGPAKGPTGNLKFTKERLTAKSLLVDVDTDGKLHLYTVVDDVTTPVVVNEQVYGDLLKLFEYNGFKAGESAWVTPKVIS